MLDTKELQRQIIALEKALRQKKKTEEALVASEKRYRRLFESARDGILILDAETGKVVDVNPFLTRLLGYSYDAGANIFGISVHSKIFHLPRKPSRICRRTNISATRICL